MLKLRRLPSLSPSLSSLTDLRVSRVLLLRSLKAIQDERNTVPNVTVEDLTAL